MTIAPGDPVPALIRSLREALGFLRTWEFWVLALSPHLLRELCNRLLDHVRMSQWGFLIWDRLGDYWNQGLLMSVLHWVLSGTCVVLFLPLARGVRGIKIRSARECPRPFLWTIGARIGAGLLIFGILRFFYSVVMDENGYAPGLFAWHAGINVVRAFLESVVPAYVAVEVSRPRAAERWHSPGPLVLPLAAIGFAGMFIPVKVMGWIVPLWFPLGHAAIDLGVTGILGVLFGVTTLWTTRFLASVPTEESTA